MDVLDDLRVPLIEESAAIGHCAAELRERFVPKLIRREWSIERAASRLKKRKTLIRQPGKHLLGLHWTPLYGRRKTQSVESLFRAKKREANKHLNVSPQLIGQLTDEADEVVVSNTTGEHGPDPETEVFKFWGGLPDAEHLAIGAIDPLAGPLGELAARNGFKQHAVSRRGRVGQNVLRRHSGNQSPRTRYHQALRGVLDIYAAVRLIAPMNQRIDHELSNGT